MHCDSKSSCKLIRNVETLFRKEDRMPDPEEILQPVFADLFEDQARPPSIYDPVTTLNCEQPVVLPTYAIQPVATAESRASIMMSRL